MKELGKRATRGGKLLQAARFLTREPRTTWKGPSMDCVDRRRLVSAVEESNEQRTELMGDTTRQLWINVVVDEELLMIPESFEMGLDTFNVGVVVLVNRAVQLALGSGAELLYA